MNNNKGEPSFTVFRTEGADVYGSFLIGISLTGSNGNIVLESTMKI